MKARFGQLGSVASFIIIGVVLVLVTTGILYWVQHKDAPIRKEAPVVTTPESEEAAPKEEKNIDREETAPSDTSSTPAPTAEPTPGTAPTVATLSQTGPKDTVFQLIALGALAVTIGSFVRSRRLRSSL